MTDEVYNSWASSQVRIYTEQNFITRPGRANYNIDLSKVSLANVRVYATLSAFNGSREQLQLALPVLSTERFIEVRKDRKSGMPFACLLRSTCIEFVDMPDKEYLISIQYDSVEAGNYE